MVTIDLGLGSLLRIAPGHPVTRWADQLDKFAGGAWMDIAADEDQWAFLEEGFVTNEGA